jgi:uncharacterized protein (DUF58 family)
MFRAAPTREAVGMNLTRRGTTLAIAILLIGVLSQWLADGSFVAGVWRWLAAAGLIAIAAEALLSRVRPLRATLNPSPPLRLGRSGDLQLTLHNDSARRARVHALWALPLTAAGTAAPLQLLIPAKGSAALGQTLMPLQLGRLAIEPVRARRQGRFGLAWWTQQLAIDETPPAVLPDLLGLSSVHAGGSLGGDHAPQRRGSGLELLGLRDYQPGDPLRAVAWKSAAKGGPLRVREFAQEQHLDVLLVIDAGRAGAQQIGQLTRLHHAVNIAARLAERTAALGDRVGVIAYAGGRVLEAPLNGGLAGVRSTRQALGRLVARSEESDPLAASLRINRLCRVRALVVWFSDFENAANGMLPQAMRQLLPKHLPLLAGIEDREVAALANQRPVDWQDPYRTLAAQQLIERAATAKRVLARLGCEVVSAPPETMDAALVARYLELRGRGRV